MIAEIAAARGLRGLYAITDTATLTTQEIVTRVEQILVGGARLIQYRDKNNPAEQRLEIAGQLKHLCWQHNAILIINDDPQLALAVQAEGVHLGRDDARLQEARRMLGKQFLIGVSCYNQFENALTAEALGADYIAFGSFYPSPTKPQAARAGIDLLQRAKRELRIPVCAIGGIQAVNATPLLAAGADMLAVISALFHAVDVRRATQELQAIICNHNETPINR